MQYAESEFKFEIFHLFTLRGEILITQLLKKKNQSSLFSISFLYFKNIFYDAQQSLILLFLYLIILKKKQKK
jgi:hypothetical protein